MLYFNSLPKILTNDQNGNPIILTNLVTRAALLEQMKLNPMLFYKYTIQDGDTPEIVAEKYYGDPYRYWLILHSNEIMDPLWEWPLTNIQFTDYINSKYKDSAELENKTPLEYTQTTIKYYEKIVIKTNSFSDDTLTDVFAITESEYNSLVEKTETYNLNSTDVCTVITTKKIVYIYDYEYELNENRRIINLLNSSYANSFEDVFKNVMV